MRVRLQTADHIRLPSPVQEAQGATAPGDRARIVRFTVCEEVYLVALRCTHLRWGIFSALLLPPLVSSAGGRLPHDRTSEVFLR
jgi:hypothetical protein